MEINLPMDKYLAGIRILTDACKKAQQSSPRMMADGLECDPPLTGKQSDRLKASGWVRHVVADIGRVVWTTKAQLNASPPRVIADPENDFHSAVRRWYLSGDRGSSSESMAAAATRDQGWIRKSIEVGHGSFPVPRDLDDLGRCIRLTRAVPTVLPLCQSTLETASRVWPRLLARWNEMDVLFRFVEVEATEQAKKRQRRWRKYPKAEALGRMLDGLLKG